MTAVGLAGMRRRRARSLVIPGAALAVLLAVAFVVVGHHRGPAATGAAPGLSADERRSLSAGLPLIEAMPAAFAQLPQAAADLSHGRLSRSVSADRLASLDGVRDLQQLLRTTSTTSAALVVRDELSVLHRQPISAASLDAAASSLQLAEGEVVPALRAVLHTVGIDLAPAAVADDVASDPGLAALSGLLGRWSQVYGSIVLLQQAANG